MFITNSIKTLKMAHIKKNLKKKRKSSEKSQDVLLCEGMSSPSVKRFQQDAVKGTPEMGKVF